jgi:hypothetical protein
MSSRAAATTNATPVPAATAQPVLQRKCACGNLTSGTAECETCADKKKLLRRKPSRPPSGPGEVPSVVHDVLRTSGQPLDSATRAYMEPRFQRDFTHVRVHTDSKAAESAKAVNALAYTVGHNVVFGASQYAPDTRAGRRLIAHELTHTLQQGGAASSALDRLTIGDVADAGEQEADRLAENVLRDTVVQPRIQALLQIQRDEDSPATHAETESSEFGPYGGCGDYREQVERARAEAGQAVASAVALLDGQHTEQAAPLLAAHFHLDVSRPENAADVQRIRAQFLRMQQALASSIRIICRGAPSPGGGIRSRLPVDRQCRSDSVLHMAFSNSCAAGDVNARVKLCEIALLEFGHPLKQTLIHEFAHIACNGNPPIRSGGAGGGEVYYDGSRLPGNEANVLVNADSYTWFALRAERVASSAAGAREESDGDHGGWIALTVLGGLLTAAGAIGLGYGILSGSNAAIGLGIAGLGLGAAGLGVGIAGVAGAFDRRRATAGRGPRTLTELAAMSAWQLGQLPETAFAPVTGGTAETTDAHGVTRADYARAWRLVRCIRDLVHLTMDPDTAEQLGRDPTAAEWRVLRRTLSQILGHANIGALVRGPGGRGELGEQPLANKVRVLDRLQWGIKRYQLEKLISPIGAGADPLVREWWQVRSCGITPGPTPHIVDQERHIVVFHAKYLEGGLGTGGFYFPPDDTIYIGEAMMPLLTGSGTGSEDARLTAGHEMGHLLGGRERTRQAFIDYYHDDHWICYWSAFEEGMAEITARDALAGGRAGTDRNYEQFVLLMRDIMQALGAERVRRAYFTGSPDREIFERLRRGLPSHMDPGLPPICRTPRP